MGRIRSPFAAVGKVTRPAGQDIPHRAGVQKDSSLRSGWQKRVRSRRCRSAKKEPLSKDSGPNGWDIGKLPMLMIQDLSSPVKKTFCRRQRTRGEACRSVLFLAKQPKIVFYRFHYWIFPRLVLYLIKVKRESAQTSFLLFHQGFK